MKETVIIESYDEEEIIKVCVLPYDEENQIITGGVQDTLPRSEAFEQYEVKGEIIEGDIYLYEDYEKPEDFLDDFGIEEDD